MVLKYTATLGAVVGIPELLDAVVITLVKPEPVAITLAKPEPVVITIDPPITPAYGGD